ncbi:hypothetical protein [Jeotgalibacillus terrae]|uniref:ABC transporter permease n=1 Tax=Jeotgalibacillus terrae TaxID=587735 RepID=A0ABW5ZJD9_9BACL|nr:hypothetical protein [Jeotgalibacillus terrae]MBM7578547.1 hypothetical protein [Jeotgalibacillus terrae]
MRLFWFELKKIFSWKLILLLGIVNFLLFYLLLDSRLEYFPNGRPAKDLYAIEKQLIPLYGAQINEEEYQDIKRLYEERVRVADKIFASDPEAKELGISNYQDFRQIELNQGELADYSSNLKFYEVKDILWELQAWESLIEGYESREESLEGDIAQTTGARQEVFQRLLENETYSFYSDVVTMDFKNYKTNLAIIVWISVAILLSLVYVRDTRAKLVPLQYTSKEGRATYKVKWWAGMTAATVLSVALTLFYMALYWTNGTQTHFGLPLSSFGWFTHWYDMTFLQYIVLSIGMIFFFSLLLSGLSLAISTMAPNTIVLIGVQIPVIFIMIAGVSRYLIHDMINVFRPQVLTPVATGVFLIATVLTVWLVWRREMKRNII